MNIKYDEKTKQGVMDRYRSGEAVSDISASTGIPKTTIYSWIRSDTQNAGSRDKQINLKMYHELETKYLRQKLIIQILHGSPCIVNSPLDERIETIDKMVYEKYTVNMLCEALCVSKGTYYNRKLRGKNGYTEAVKKRERITPKIKEIYDESNQIYGPASS